MIERLYIQNFRCLESVTLDFVGSRSALLIGKNGVGKSTVRESLALFQDICRGHNRTGDLIFAKDFSHHNLSRPMRFEIDLTLTGKRFKYAVSFDWPENFREARILDEGLWVDGEMVFQRQHAQITLSGGSAFGLDWHVFALPIIEERPNHQAIKDLKAFFAAMIVIAPIPAIMVGFSEEPSAELAHDATNYASSLRALIGLKPAAYSAFDSYIKSVMPDFSLIENAERGKSGTQLTVRFEQQEPPRSLTVEFDALSDGEKCFFLCAYLIAAATVGLPVICFWDEPDNHLSLSQVGQFITGLRKMAQRSGQFIATSHHPEAMRKFSDETTIVLTRKTHLDPTVPKRLTEFSYGGDLVNALIREEIIG